MKNSFVFLGLLLSSIAVAEVTDVPNTFVADAPINATDMNNNFSHVTQQITNVDSAMDTRVSALESVSGSGSGTALELVGFTTATTSGGPGYIGMSRMCQTEFTGSRFCTSVEMVNTVNLPSLPASTVAWIRPLYQNGNADSVTGGAVGTCNSWASNSSSTTGMTVEDKGLFSAAGCNQVRPVACCK